MNGQHIVEFLFHGYTKDAHDETCARACGWGFGNKTKPFNFIRTLMRNFGRAQHSGPPLIYIYLLLVILSFFSFLSSCICTLVQYILSTLDLCVSLSSSPVCFSSSIDIYIYRRFLDEIKFSFNSTPRDWFVNIRLQISPSITQHVHQ
jgi:hypothetical protein